MDADVIIIGGGISGSVLALGLGRRGRRVIVLERQPAPPRIDRPEILQSAALEALDSLGVGRAVRERAAIPLEGIRIYRGDERLLTVGREDFEAAHVAPLSTDPAATRALITDAATATPGVELLTGAEVTEILRNGARPVGVAGRRNGEPFELRAPLLIGDDGVRSVTRQRLEIPIALRIFPMEFITFGIERPAEFEPNVARVWVNPDALRRGLAAGLFVPLPGDRIAGVILSPLGTWARSYEKSPETFWQALRALTPLADVLRERLPFPGAFHRLQRPWGHARTYVTDGAALIGDAAHPMSPVGGQGANAAIMDALVLADVADRALAAGDLSRTRLAEYERRRRPANRRSLAFTRRAVAGSRVGRLLPGLVAPILPGLLKRIDRRTRLKRGLLRQAATAFIGG